MNYIKVGKIQNTLGLDGKIIIKYELPVEKAFGSSDHIFIELNPGSYIPFFILDRKFLSANEILLKLDEMDHPEAAKLLIDKNVFLDAADFPSAPASDPQYEQLHGFLVSDEYAGSLGAIETIFETPGQLVAGLYYKGKEILIPLIPQMVIAVDSGKKTVFVRLPSGFLDVYLT